MKAHISLTSNCLRKIAADIYPRKYFYCEEITNDRYEYRILEFQSVPDKIGKWKK